MPYCTSERENGTRTFINPSQCSLEIGLWLAVGCGDVESLCMGFELWA